MMLDLTTQSDDTAAAGTSIFSSIWGGMGDLPVSAVRKTDVRSTDAGSREDPGKQHCQGDEKTADQKDDCDDLRQRRSRWMIGGAVLFAQRLIAVRAPVVRSIKDHPALRASQFNTGELIAGSFHDNLPPPRQIKELS